MSDQGENRPSPLGSSGVMARRHRFPTGTVLGGRYEVLKCLGDSMRGAVYLTSDRALNHQPFAVKVMWFTKKQLEIDPTILERFQNEAEVAHRVRHPNVVASYEYFAGEDYFAFSMDYVAGGTLRDLMKSGRKLTSIEIIDMLMQACAGLHAIHRVGTVHRDIKPENLLVTKHGEIKLTDFGIARVSQAKNLTAVGSILGTMEYCSPEYLMENKCDVRSDIYALGLIAYELITGQMPYHGETVFGTVRERLSQDPPPPDSVTEDCSPELSNIIMKSLCRDPEGRYQSAYEMYDELSVLLPEDSESELPRMNQSGSKKVSAAHLKKMALRRRQRRRQAILSVAWFFTRLLLITFGVVFAIYFLIRNVLL